MSDNEKQAIQFDVVGIGNAMVDILAYTNDDFLTKSGLIRGATTLIDEKKAAELYKKMGTATECSGGSVANSMAGIASLGGVVAYIGKVANDQLGDTFRHDMKTLKVNFTTKPLEGGASTASCLVLVTNEEKVQGTKEIMKAERTMATFLGACRSLTEADIDEEIIKNSKITYLEGYLWDVEAAKKAINKAIEIAHANNRKVAFSLSDPFCVERHREAFMNLLKNNIDILFANETEIKSLFREKDLRMILPQLKGICEIAVVTRSDKGSIIITKDEIHNIEAVKVAEVYDVTGAGDLYASGFLYGLVKGFDLAKCGKLAGLAAAEVIKYLGARPLAKLTDLLKLL